MLRALRILLLDFIYLFVDLVDSAFFAWNKEKDKSRWSFSFLSIFLENKNKKS